MLGTSRTNALPSVVLALWASACATAPAPIPVERAEDGIRSRIAEQLGVAPERVEIPRVLNLGKVELSHYFPPEARAKGLSGAVLLRVRIEANGYISKVEVTADPGSGFGEAAARAVTVFRFTPAKVDGRPVVATIPFKIVFE